MESPLFIALSTCPLQNGLMMGLGSLLVLWLALECLGRWIQPSDESKPEVATPSSSGNAPSVSEDIDPTIVAVIAAAVHAALKKPHHILTIAGPSRVNFQSWEHQSWSEEGRRQIYASHRVR